MSARLVDEMTRRAEARFPYLRGKRSTREAVSFLIQQLDAEGLLRVPTQERMALIEGRVGSAQGD